MISASHSSHRCWFLGFRCPFGHVGMGGSLGFADPSARMSFGYTMNRQGLSVGLDERGQSLVDATYEALGYTRSARAGNWYR